MTTAADMADGELNLLNDKVVLLLYIMNGRHRKEVRSKVEQ